MQRQENCPSGNCSAIWRATCTAKAVLPIPAIPPISQMAATSPAIAASATAAISFVNSGSRPVNDAASGGRVRVAAAALPALGTASPG